MAIKLLVFDFDGVFADSFDLYRDAFMSAFRAQRLDVDEAELANLLGSGMRNIIGKLIPSREADPDSLITELKTHINQYVLSPGARERYKLLPHVVEFLNEMDVKYQIPRVILSHSIVPYLSRYLGKFDLETRFTKVLGGDSGHESKAAALSALAEEFKIKPEEIMFFGDTIWDMQQGLDAGVIRTGVVGWHTADMLRETQPDHIVVGLKEIIGLLGRY